MRGQSTIAQILPSGVVVVETRNDTPDAKLFPEEESALGDAVAKRRLEFTTARACAREALGRLGLSEVPVPTGERGEPCWPPGVVGSITHCEGYRACAVARSEQFLAIGIDAEPHAPLPTGLIGDIARPEERHQLGDLEQLQPRIHWDRALFSAKESLYKAWFPLERRWLGFEDAHVTLEPASGRFTARLLVGGDLASGIDTGCLSGRWAVVNGVLATAIVLPRFPRSPQGPAA